MANLSPIVRCWKSLIEFIAKCFTQAPRAGKRQARQVIFKHALDKTPKHLLEKENATTVIIGSGVISLSTAIWIKRNCAHHEVFICEISSELCSHASKNNSGYISYEGLPKDIRALGKYSYELYMELFDNRKIRESVGYKQNGIFEVCKGSGSGLSPERFPSWAKVPNGFHVVQHPQTGSADTLNPNGLRQWLLQECRKLNVITWNNCTVESAYLDANGHIEKVLVQKGEKRELMKCQNLLLAAGPWTPQTLKWLFPRSNVQLKEATSSGNWVVLQSPPSSKLRPSQMIFDEVVGHQLEFVERNDGTIWACGLNNKSSPLNKPTGVAKPDSQSIARLLQYATRFIQNEDGTPISPVLIKQGRSYRPVSHAKALILAEMSSEDCLGAHERMQNSSQAGSHVYVSFGHGPHGISLGFGIGKILSQLILKEIPDVDLSLFDFPRN